MTSSISHSLSLSTPANLRIESGCGVFHLLDEPRHVFQEEIVEMLLLHVLELEDGFIVTAGHGWSQWQTEQESLTRAVLVSLGSSSVRGGVRWSQQTQNTTCFLHNYLSLSRPPSHTLTISTLTIYIATLTMHCPFWFYLKRWWYNLYYTLLPNPSSLNIAKHINHVLLLTLSQPWRTFTGNF